MGKPQRTAAVKFDDIPGKLPRGKVPEDTDRTSVANNAVDRLNNLQLDDLHDDAIWRDLLSFTGTYRTFYSQKTVFATLQKLSKEKQRSRFTLEGIEPRIGRTVDGTFWLDIDASCSTFENSIVGECRGTVSVVLCEDGEWRIWMLRTWLESFEGHGHPDVLEPVMAVSNGAGHEPADTCANGASDSSAMNGHGATTDYDAIVVGGGQAGLSTAGRLKALGIRYILLERRPEIGDVWKTRYESLRWHTSKHYGSLPFGHTYPEEDDYMLPAKRIGAGHRAWAEKFGINVQTGTAVESASWDESQTRWTVTVSSTAGKQTLTARNLVLSIGVGHLTPVLPDWATPSQVSASNFHGTVLHGSQYKSCAAFAGKPGLVVGTANTAHDVAEDMANADMSPTMIQRGSTFVFPAEWLHRAEDVHYHPAMDPADADRESFTYPNKIMREIINRAVWTGIKRNPDRFDALERAGFKVDRYGDIYDNLYVRFGGHYVDIGASARIAGGEIKVNTQSVRGLTETGVVFEDGSKLAADLIVLCTGFDHDFRHDAAEIVGQDVANQMDDFWCVDAEGEVRGHAKFAGHPNLYYHGGDIRMGRFFSRFVALQIQAEVLGKPMRRYTD
ncbi:hypothetical protein B0A54_11760 [Friedmanniomyces endolithicus]|uniref:FAD/NAD(P)-binding domain-containing protein n=1 Tax=Friedmanniomyces endolithicus TaxID=329885 RepID=A0A4U0URM8_9PEZI|nr:hypothetical protein LTS09_004322 [Friedmanniomyces endolithicus]TKA37676.1 hypothetical protein B0A54_11760 [Friedmanniomyces endolithicus]